MHSRNVEIYPSGFGLIYVAG